MSTISHPGGLDELKRSWGWFVALGLCLVILGFIAAGSAMFTTLAAVWLYGWLMIVGGVFEAGHAFWRRKWSGFFLSLLSGLLSLVVGFMLVMHPGESAAVLTLLIALFLIFAGIFRIVVSIAAPLHHRLWVGLHGVITLLLGISIWRNWPLSGLWVIGLFIGIEMIVNGITLVMLGLKAKQLPAEAA